jgi:hypothetical protein
LPISFDPRAASGFVCLFVLVQGVFSPRCLVIVSGKHIVSADTTCECVMLSSLT